MGALIAVAGGGAIGSVLRHLISLALRGEAGGFPWHTFAVNVIGSFLLGLLVALLPTEVPAARSRLFLGVGVLGGFTTFSTLSMEAVALINQGAAGLAAGYAVGSLLAGVLGAYGGYVLGRAL